MAHMGDLDKEGFVLNKADDLLDWIDDTLVDGAFEGRVLNLACTWQRPHPALACSVHSPPVGDVSSDSVTLVLPRHVHALQMRNVETGSASHHTSTLGLARYPARKALAARPTAASTRRLLASPCSLKMLQRRQKMMISGMTSGTRGNQQPLQLEPPDCTEPRVGTSCPVCVQSSAAAHC